MYYELYVDVLFLVNFFMDYILLLFVWKILHCDTSHIRIVFGGLTGAILTCILIIFPIPNAFVEFILFHSVVNTCMVRVGLKIKNLSVFLKALILLYIGAFFMGGIVESVSQYIEIGSMIVLFAIAGYYIALGMWKFLGKLQRWNTHLVKVELVDSGTVVKIKGLIDTGNSLFDPVSGKPVSIVTREVAKNFVGNNKKIRYIPYQSVGKSDGVMPVFHIDEMRIIGQEPYCFQHILLGISEENVSLAGAYDMILNPNLF